MVKCIISDLGKVILFFDNHIFFRKMADHCPYSAEGIAGRVHVHRGLIQAFDTGKIGSDDFYREVVNRLYTTIDRQTFYGMYNDVFSLNRSVLDLLKLLKSRYKMLLLSNTDSERFGYIKETFPEIFIFDHYILSYEVGYMKPHPLIYKEALKRAQSSAEECVFIDDMEENVQRAQEIGMYTILYGPDTDLPAELIKLGISL